MNNEMDFNFDDIDLGGIDLGGETKPSNVIPFAVKATVDGGLVVNDQEVELNEEQTKVVEKDAVDNSEPISGIDSFIDQFKEPTKAELEKVRKAEEAKTKAATTPKPAPKPPVVEEKYEGPRTVRVYGSELFIESDPNITLEQIRQRLVDEFRFVEFTKDRTTMFLDKATGIVVPQPHFEKRG